MFSLKLFLWNPHFYLWMKKVHREDHSGVLRTVAKSRRKFWISKGSRLAEQIRRSCYLCRLIDKMLASQIMAPLPSSRQMISPIFHVISLDLFGPFEIRETVNKRKRKKVWGIIFTCVAICTYPLSRSFVAKYNSKENIIMLL